MGIYDRDYYREEESTGILTGRSMVTNIIILNCVVFLANMLMDGRLNDWMQLWSDIFTRPWNCWQLVTSGFAHADLMHLAFNMMGLWIFGPDVEDRYRRAEFTRIYFATLIFSGLFWAAAETVIHRIPVPLIGASGAVTGIVLLSLIYNPRRELLVFGMARVPAWFLAAILLLSNVIGAVQRTDVIAHTAHLGGAIFTLAYFYFHWNFTLLVPSKLLKRLRAPKLRVHKPPQENSRDLTAEVDKILDKIHRLGEASLTNEERRTLEEASRRYQRRQ